MSPPAGIDTDALARPEFLPDPDRSRKEMESLQRELAASATFVDDLGFGPDAVAFDEPADLSAGLPPARTEALGELDANPDAPVVVGVDQAFRPERDEAVSAAVAFRGGRVVEYAEAVTPLSIPYVPGLLAFREGEPMLAALEDLSVAPDFLVCDGSGRIHFRQAGIATHIGVICDLPSVGVAKSLLCGEPDEPVGERPEGWSTPIRADDSVERVGGLDEDRTGDDADVGTDPPGTDLPVVGHAYQSRQYPNSRRVNPLYVSPGHRVSPETAVDLVAALCAGYKLPEPTRLADAHADRVKRRLGGDE
ncbi:endonuclease V [Halorubrum cibi]|uniref:Endonuclease V n=1 Tax=Halorubrum cibi TaxID=413815 RepID=A0A521EFX7_9EURY|nr:endonuclease V [Halorubrum cibi]SMO82772.1 Endonuclease V [Halorubrum cibi]